MKQKTHMTTVLAGALLVFVLVAIVAGVIVMLVA